MWLDGKTVIITGASGGLGFAMAKLLIEKHGCTVIGVARNREKAEKAAAALGDMFSFRLFDVTDRTGWTSFARELDESGLVPDVLINNAGIMPAFARAETCSDSDISAIVENKFHFLRHGGTHPAPPSCEIDNPRCRKYMQRGRALPRRGRKHVLRDKVRRARLYGRLPRRASAVLRCGDIPRLHQNRHNAPPDGRCFPKQPHSEHDDARRYGGKENRARRRQT